PSGYSPYCSTEKPSHRTETSFHGYEAGRRIGLSGKEIIRFYHDKIESGMMVPFGPGCLPLFTVRRALLLRIGCPMARVRGDACSQVSASRFDSHVLSMFVG